MVLGSVEGGCTGVSFLIRVVLPDKPGSLGAVATALGNANGWVKSGTAPPSRTCIS